MSFLIPSVSIVFSLLTLLILIVSVLGVTIVSIVIVISLRLGFFAIVHKRSLGPVLVIKVRKALIIDAQFKHVSVLHNVQHMVVYLKGVLERSAELLNLKYHLSVFVDFLLST